MIPSFLRFFVWTTGWCGKYQTRRPMQPFQRSSVQHTVSSLWYIPCSVSVNGWAGFSENLFYWLLVFYYYVGFVGNAKAEPFVNGRLLTVWIWIDGLQTTCEHGDSGLLQTPSYVVGVILPPVHLKTIDNLWYPHISWSHYKIQATSTLRKFL